MTSFKFDRGDKVRDVISGFEGIVISQTVWLNGCVRYTLEAQEMAADGKLKDHINVDEGQLMMVQQLVIDVGQEHRNRPVKAAEKPPGGPRPSPTAFGR